MAKEYHVWRVCYRYQCRPCDSTEHTESAEYFIIAGTEKEAEKKADKKFAYSDINKQLLSTEFVEGGCVRLSGLRKMIVEHRTKLPTFSLTPDSDKDKFSLKPKITKDNTLEYIVTKLAK